jgi:uncharacterized membrane protein YdbT with pleckstrin-like domain
VNNRLILNNLKVTRQRGIIEKTIMTVELAKVQDVKIYFGIVGRIIGFGTLEIESSFPTRAIRKTTVDESNGPSF